MALQQVRSIKIAYLSHYKDKSVLEMLRKYLAGLRRENLIQELPDILAGTDIKEQVSQNLNAAQVVMLLMSSDFDDDNFYGSPEVVAIIKDLYEKGVQIWPIIIRDFLWEKSCYKRYKVFFGEKRALLSYSPQDEGYKLIAVQIGNQIERMIAEELLHEANEDYKNFCLSSALIACEQSLKLIPNFVPALLTQGQTLLKQGKIEEANQCFELIVSTLSKNNAKDIESFNSKRKFTNIACYKGYALLELRRYYEALNAFQEIYQPFELSNIQKDVLAEAYCGEGDAYSKLASKNKEYYEQALDLYRRANHLVPDSPKYLLGIAKVRIGQGIHLQSINFLEDALDICKRIILDNPNYASAYVERGEAYYYLQYFKDALRAYDQAIQINPYEVQAYASKGFVLLDLHNPQEALTSFEKAVSLDITNAKFHYGKGRSQAGLGYYQEALNSYNQARNQGFNSLELLYYLSDTLVELGEAEFLTGHKQQGAFYFKEAEDIYKYLRSHWPKPENIQFQWGRIFFAYKNWDNAKICYEKSISFAPYKSDGYLGMGKLFTEIGRYNDGLICLNKACALQNNDIVNPADIDIAYGDIYYRLAGELGSKEYQDNQKKARGYFEEAVSIRRDAKAYIGLGKVYSALHLLEKAMVAFDEALIINPNISQCYFLKGKCCQELGRASEAYNLYQQAISLGFNNASIQIAKGDVLMAMKSYVEAKDIFDNLINGVAKNDANVYCKKGVVLHELKNDEAAVDAFTHAYSLDNSICLQPQYKRTLEDIYTSFEIKLLNEPPISKRYAYSGDILIMLNSLTEKAVEFYTKAIDIGDTSAITYCNRGEAYCKLFKSYKRLRYGVFAIKDYREALMLDSTMVLAQQGEEFVNDTVAQMNFVRRFLFRLRTL